MAYDLRHTGEAIDAAVYAVERGSVVTENTAKEVTLGEAKPASADAIAKELQNKVDKVEGKGLSTNDYTNDEKAQVAENKENIAKNAEDIEAHRTALTEHDVAIAANTEAIERKAEQNGRYSKLTSGFAENIVGDGSATEEVIGFRPTAGEERNVANTTYIDGERNEAARMTRIKGNSVVWNQQSQVFSATYTQSSNGIDATPIFGTHYTECSGTTTTIEGDSSIYIDSSIAPKPQGVVGHKYLFLVEGCKTLQVTLYRFVSPSVRITNGGTIVTCTANDYIRYAIYIPTSTPAGTTINEKISVLFVDLTLMFGAGNEPTTVEEFYQRMPVGVDINAYNEGEIVNGNYEAIMTTGFNQWDEQWEKGYIVSTTGVPADSNNVIRTKNFIPVIPSASYYCEVLNSIAGNAHFYEYDEEYNFIKTIWSVGNRTNVISQNCRYIKASFGSASTPVTTYNNDICINLVWPEYTSLNGTYQPYKPFTCDLSWIKKYFNDGMRRAGSVRDEVRFNFTTKKWEAVQNVGVRAYASGDESNTAVTTDGKNTNYALATPKVTEITEDITLDYDCSDYGTEELISEGVSAPLVADVVYAPNALSTLKQVPDILRRLAILEAKAMESANVTIEE